MGNAFGIRRRAHPQIASRFVSPDISRNASKGQRQIVLALIHTAFAQETTGATREPWRVVADHVRP
jgi:hypothetical protein